MPVIEIVCILDNAYMKLTSRPCLLVLINVFLNIRNVLLSLRTWLKDRLSKFIPYETPYALSWSGWDDWKTENKSKYPIAFFLFEDAPLWISCRWTWWIINPYYHLKCKYFTKHHYIKIDVERFMGLTYKNDSALEFYHWYDTDTKMLFGVFQLLVDFVEKEEAGERIDWSQTPQHQKVWDEIQELYTWWTEIRPKQWRENETPSMEDYGTSMRDFDDRAKSTAYKAWSKACDEKHKKEEELLNEDTEMLIRLITIRRWLWT